MAALLACVLLCGGSADRVRLELRNGEAATGTLEDVDAEGRYVLVLKDGTKKRIPYREVVDVRILAGGNEWPEGNPARPRWPEFPRIPDLVSFVMDRLGEIGRGEGESAEEEIGRAVELVRGRDLTGALRRTAEALKRDPAALTSLLMHAALAAETGGSDAAFESALTAIRFHPDSSAAYRVASEIAYRRGLESKGNDFYAEALARSSSGPEKLWRLAHFWRARDEKKARSFFDAYLAADPDLTGAFSVEGMLLRRARALAAAGKTQEAAAAFAQLFAGSPRVARRFSKEFGDLLKKRARELARAGKTEAAVCDLEEAEILVPEEKNALAKERRKLVLSGLYEACRVVRSLSRLDLIRDRLAGEDPGLSGKTLETLAFAYSRLFRDFLRRGEAVRAVACLEHALKAGIVLSRRAEVAAALKSRRNDISAEDAYTLSRALYRVDSSFLREKGRFLLDPQAARLRTKLGAGKVDFVGKRLSELKEMFGEAPELRRLEADWTFRRNKRLAVASGSTSTDSRNTVAAGDLLAYFPVEEGRWWRYVSRGGGKEYWRVAKVRKKSTGLEVSFTGEAVQGDRKVPCGKVAYITHNAVFVSAPSPELGGRLLMWEPAGKEEKPRVFENGPSRSEISYASLADTVTVNGKTYEDCRHVVVRNSLVDPAGEGVRFTVESHYWYAPEVGLVKIEDDEGNVWELAAWGREGEKAEEPAVVSYPGGENDEAE